MTGNRLFALLLSLLALVACDSPTPRSLTAQQNLNSAAIQATNAAMADQADAKRAADAQARVTEQARAESARIYNATAQAVNATAQAQQAIASATEQARADAAAQLTLEQQQIAATATRQALDRQMQIDAQAATRTAAEVKATITAANAGALAIEQSKSRESDLAYILPDYLMRYAPCGAILLTFLLVWYLVRAVASRIAGDEGRAKMALASPSFTVYLPTALLPAPRDNDDENEIETGNRETAGNSRNSEETGRETGEETPDLLTLGYNGERRPAPRMSREEYHELVNIRQEAITLLDRCVAYYREAQAADDGTIPRYDKIHMQAEDRGRIVDNLWYSQYVIKSPNKTSVDPAYYPTCAALMQAIINKVARVYPMGYHERKQQRLDEAVAALPGIAR